MDPNAPHIDPADRRAAWIAAGLLALVAAYCLARGMPWPHPDDIAFLGTGVDLARTGQLANHLLDGWLAGFGTNKYYIQLPFQAYSMALWFRLFGVHTASILVFQWMWYVAGIWGLVQTLGRFGLALGVRLFLATVYLLAMVGYGCRPDAEADGLLFLGLVLVNTSASFPWRLAALILLGCAFLSYPIVLAIAAPFGLALAWLTLPPGLAGLERWRVLARAWVLPAILAAAVAFLMFLAMIHGDLAGFLHVFNAHRQMRVNNAHPFATYFAMNVRYHEALLTLPYPVLLVAAAAWVAWRWRRVEPGTRVLVAACVVAAVGSILLYAVKGPELIGLLSLFAVGSVISMQSLRSWRWPLALGLAVFYFASQTLGLLNLTLRRFPDPAVWRAARETAVTSGKTLVLDSSTARYVFDYQYPPGTAFASYLRMSTGEHPYALATDKKADQVWVVTAVILSADGGYVDVPPEIRDYPRLRIGRHEFHSIARCPDLPVVFP